MSKHVFRKISKGLQEALEISLKAEKINIANTNTNTSNSRKPFTIVYNANNKKTNINNNNLYFIYTSKTLHTKGSGCE